MIWLSVLQNHLPSSAESPKHFPWFTYLTSWKEAGWPKSETDWQKSSQKWTLIVILLKTLTFHFQLVQLLPRTICRCFKHRDGFLLVSTFLFTLTPPPHILCSNQLELEQRFFGCKTSITFTRRSGVGRPPRTPARLPHYCLGIWFGCFLPTANILKVPHITTKHHLYYLQRLALKAQC